MDATDRLKTVREDVAKAERDSGREPGSVTIVAVSKTFSADTIAPVIDAGQRIFGENRVQEAQAKWPELRKRATDLELRLIGPLQSNKAADAVALFDVIETVDRDKIARALSVEMEKQQKRPRLFVQVNTGSEPQKAGVEPTEVVHFVENCRTAHGLVIEGLMCIPPIDENPGPHFALLEKLAREAGVAGLSMGMSADFETAIAFGATSVRVGSAIFGPRAKPAG
ncbi:YggS family pyridoxal phosphate-dependent enzyme [Hoeflea sp.]|uniref:YggS family pyridoxal phosphate-dependent enzyme n=1 Tax=Hoeflea sp. TaxID=1940281 RepID=UPI003B0184E6